MSNYTVLNHPLIQHKLTRLRDKSTGTNEFRQLVNEITLMEAYEATKNLPLEDCPVETPFETVNGKQISGKNLALVPVLRAGLGMLDAFLELVPTAKVGFVGLYRDPETFKPVQYYVKLPQDISQRQAFIIDPMLATGGSTAATVDLLNEQGCHHITVCCIVSAPEGLKVMEESHPEVPIYTCSVDRQLNDKAYILPGLGDAGDRLFGTK